MFLSILLAKKKKNLLESIERERVCFDLGSVCLSGGVTLRKLNDTMLRVRGYIHIPG